MVQCTVAQVLGVEVPGVLALYRRQAVGLLAVQGRAGGWHNILTNASTLEETSASAMFLAGLARGRRQGWLQVEELEGLEEALAAAWQLVAGRVMEDGTITGRLVLVLVVVVVVMVMAGLYNPKINSRATEAG